VPIAARARNCFSGESSLPGCCEDGNEPSGSIKGGVSQAVERLSAFRCGVICLDLTNCMEQQPFGFVTEVLSLLDAATKCDPRTGRAFVLQPTEECCCGRNVDLQAHWLLAPCHHPDAVRRFCIYVTSVNFSLFWKERLSRPLSHFVCYLHSLHVLPSLGPIRVWTEFM
jgi:hypothetical protein